MFLLREPSDEAIRRFLEAQGKLPFSYPEVGATRGEPPRRFTADHNRVRLGTGRDAFERAVAAVRRWEMFHFDWIRLCWPDAPIEAGSTVAVVSRQYGCWTLNACRIVYVVDEAGPVRRYGFAYGTLPQHVETGEERFTVQWRRDDDSVWYDVLALSRPHHWLATLGYPVTRHLQKRFAEDSMVAMVRAFEAGDPGVK